MQTGLGRMRTESLAAPRLRAGKRFSAARDRRPQTAFERSSFLAETRTRLARPRQIFHGNYSPIVTLWRRTDAIAAVLRPDGYLEMGSVFASVSAAGVFSTAPWDWRPSYFPCSSCRFRSAACSPRAARSEE